MSKELEDTFYKEFYDFCKEVFDKCCDIEEELFFPSFTTAELKKRIANDNIQYPENKGAFLNKINETNFFSNFMFHFDDKIKAKECEEKLEIENCSKIRKFLGKIEEHLQNVPAFKHYVENKSKDEKKELLKVLSSRLYIIQFLKTNEHNSVLCDVEAGKETGIKLPSFSLSADQKKKITTRLYDAIEFLRELLQFRETESYENFFSFYILRLYNNYNQRESENKKDIERRKKLRGKIKEAILNLSLDDEYKKCYIDFVDGKELWKVPEDLLSLQKEGMLSENDKDILLKIRNICNEYKKISVISYDQPICENNTLEDFLKDDTIPSPEMEIIEQEEQIERGEKIRQAPNELANIQRRVKKFLGYVSVNNPQDRTLDIDKIIEIKRKIIFSFFCPREINFIDTTKEIDLRRQIYNELCEIYGATNRRELNYALDINSHHNILCEILDSFRTKINQKRCRQENDENEIKKLSNYLTNVRNRLQG